MGKGIIITAHGDNYVNMAEVAALLAKHHLDNISVVLITDGNSYQHCNPTIFDDVLFVKDTGHENRRVINGTVRRFLNRSRLDVFDLSPFHETLVMDADYLVFSGWLNHIWGTDRDLMATHKVRYINGNTGRDDPYLYQHGIIQHWSTLLYFKKTTRTRLVYDIMNHVHENYFYYSNIYGFSPSTFRNDYALSIALHIVEGSQFTDFSFPMKELLFTKFDDVILDVPAIGEMVFQTTPKNQGQKSPMVKLKDQDVHVLNKDGLKQFLPKLKEMYAR